MPLDPHRAALSLVADDVGDLMQGTRRILADVGLVEIEQHVGGQFDANLRRGLLDVQRLNLAGHLDRLPAHLDRFAAHVDDRELQILEREG